MDKEQNAKKIDAILKKLEGAIKYKGSASDLLHELKGEI